VVVTYHRIGYVIRYCAVPLLRWCMQNALKSRREMLQPTILALYESKPFEITNLTAEYSTLFKSQ